MASGDKKPAKARKGETQAGELSPWEPLPRLRDLMRRHPLAICDATTLPLPKPEMKNALKIAWELATDDQQRAEIEAGFLYLSQFQDGIGAEPIDGDFPPTPDPIATATLVNRWLPWSALCEEDKWSLWIELVEFKKQRAIKALAVAA